MEIKPFRGIRPHKENAALVASPPYDVLDSREARALAAGNPFSFLNIVKSEITLPPDIDPYDNAVYQAAQQNLKQFRHRGILIQDPSECFYLYELTMNGRSQNGLVACVALDDYINGNVRKHELTRPDKENGRKRHIRTTMADAEPVLFAYPDEEGLNQIYTRIKQNEPEYMFEAEDGVLHRFWVISDAALISQITAGFRRIPVTYVADGHHRTAAAAGVGIDLRNENRHHTGKEPYNYFLAVHFPDSQLSILDYNRVVKDLNGHSPQSFINALMTKWTIAPGGKELIKPSKVHKFSMYLDGLWYRMTPSEGSFNENDPIDVLDVSILSNQILGPLLGITDLRTEKRIECVGGMRGLGELQRRVDSGEMKVAFALYPVTMAQLKAIADSGKIMPPKTTWFEPKLRSGLIIYSLEE